VAEFQIFSALFATGGDFLRYPPPSLGRFPRPTRARGAPAAGSSGTAPGVARVRRRSLSHCSTAPDLGVGGKVPTRFPTRFQTTRWDSTGRTAGMTAKKRLISRQEGTERHKAGPRQRIAKPLHGGCRSPSRCMVCCEPERLSRPARPAWGCRRSGCRVSPCTCASAFCDFLLGMFRTIFCNFPGTLSYVVTAPALRAVAAGPAVGKPDSQAGSGVVPSRKVGRPAFC
jgi:hypothetical protein